MTDILLITDSLPGAPTSMAAMVGSLAKCLAGQGHRVSVAGMGAEEHVRDYPLGVFIRGLKHNSLVVRGGLELVGALRIALRIARAVARREAPVPALIVSFQPSLFLALTASLLKRWYGCRLFLVQRDLVPDWLIAAGRLRPGVATWFLARLKELSLADADGIGIECAENELFVRPRHYPRLQVLDNWRDYSPATVFNAASPAQFTLIYGGRVGFAQGFDRFLDALIEADLQRIRIKIYCDDRGATELGRIRESRRGTDFPELDVRGMLPEDEFLARAAYCSMGIVSLSPTMLTHNIPGKLLGYLAAGLPVFAIGPKNSALGRLVAELGIGLYADADDRPSIVRNLRRAASDQALLQDLRNNAITARSRFAVEAAARQIYSIMDR